jgi:hypothetical protein
MPSALRPILRTGRQPELSGLCASVLGPHHHALEHLGEQSLDAEGLAAIAKGDGVFQGGNFLGGADGVNGVFGRQTASL